MRVRDKWRGGSRPRTLAENGEALAYVAWQIALTATKNLHAEDYIYRDDRQRVAVLAEYLFFLIHVADRMAHELLGAEQRAEFLQSLAAEAARQYQRNLEDIQGRGDFRGPFVDTLNERVAIYAATRYDAGGPGYEMRRVLGHAIQDVMGSGQTNKWVLQQVMDVDAPEAWQHLRQALENLLTTAQLAMLDASNAAVGPD